VGQGPAPWEYIEYLLCRHVWHCTPAELRQQSAEDILNALSFVRVEGQVRELNAAL
jgi:hypothetical protein